MLPLAFESQELGRFVSRHTSFDRKAKSSFQVWAKEARANYLEIEPQLTSGYGLPELEMLRAEICFCIIQGFWQGAICLTNVLLEAALKLSLVYSNVEPMEGNPPPLTRIANSLSGPAEKYMKCDLHETISFAFKQELISKAEKNALHGYRKRIRNGFFHADMQAMFGDRTTPVTAADFDSLGVQNEKVPIHSLPILLGEAMWHNARVNAIPYFKEVDGLIRRLLSRVFPHLAEEDD